jgi:nucleoside phosphorylase
VADGDVTYPAVADKWRDPSLHGPEQFLGGARAAGWDPGAIPEGAVFVFDHRLRTHLEQRDDSIEAPELAPGNARVFRIGPAIVSCLSPGAAAMVTQMENLAYLGTRRFVVVGAAGSIAEDVRPGATLVPTAAVRDDGISQHYLPPARLVTPSQALSERLRRLLPDALGGATWTVPVPYRMTRRELDLHRANGVVAVEMEAAALFAVAEAIGVDAAAVLVISDQTTADRHVEDWAATTEPLLRALAAGVSAARRSTV